MSRHAESEATGEGTLRGNVRRKRLFEQKTKGTEGAKPPPSKGQFWERPLKGSGPRTGHSRMMLVGSRLGVGRVRSLLRQNGKGAAAAAGINGGEKVDIWKVFSHHLLRA